MTNLGIFAKALGATGLPAPSPNEVIGHLGCECLVASGLLYRLRNHVAIESGLEASKDRTGYQPAGREKIPQRSSVDTHLGSRTGRCFALPRLASICGFDAIGFSRCSRVIITPHREEFKGGEKSKNVAAERTGNPSQLERY